MLFLDNDFGGDAMIDLSIRRVCGYQLGANITHFALITLRVLNNRIHTLNIPNQQITDPLI